MRKKIRKIATSISKKSLFLRFFIKKIRKLYYNIRYFKYVCKYKINDKFILFEAFQGRSFSDSPKAIYNELKNNPNFDDYTLIWAFGDVNKEEFLDDDRVIIVEYNTKEYLKYFAKSKYIVTNSRINLRVFKRKGQIYIQTWHGTPLKRIGCDIKVKGKNALYTNQELKETYETQAREMDYLISPSKFATEKFITAFNLSKFKKEDIIVEEGYPRNDFLINYTEKDKKVILKRLGIDKNNKRKIILYAPTWRDNMHKSGLGYTYYPKVDFKLLKEKLFKDYIILYRAHYFVANEFNFDEYKNFIYDVSKLDDINELYIISDILITDYSSVFFDYANLNRPILFHMYDLEFYKEELRGFYLNLDELPGPISEKDVDLIKNIKNIEKIQKEYKEKYKKFNDKFTYLDDGNATKRVVEYIFDLK